ncbi:MAG: type IV pilus secretin PilQ [Terriglobia bacterium]|jgi:type IV pilus assembly protein PilQ
MKRQAIVLLAVTWLMLGLVPTPRSRAWAASEAATLKSVTLSASPTGTELVLRVDGSYSYKTVQGSPDTLFIDLAGAKAEGVARSHQWVNPVFSGYKLLPYKDASGQPIVRVQVDTKQAIPFVVQKDGSKLRLLYGKSLPTRDAAAPAPAVAPEETSAPLATSAPSSGPLLVSKITLDKHESGETFVDVATSRSAGFRVMMLPSPARLVVDIEGAQNTSPQKNYVADTPVLTSVRVGQFRAKDPSIVRVVAVLNGNPAFDVHNTPAGVRIELRPRGAAKAVSLPNQAPVAPAKPGESNTVETAAVAPPPVAAPIVAASAPTTEVIDPKPAGAPPLRVETRDAAKPDIQSTLPAIASSQQAVATPLPPPASSTPEALRAKQAAQVLTLGKDASPEAAQGGPPATPSSTAEEAKPVYTGEPISLNLKDVDLKDFFRLIHEISGLNIIIDPNVSGSVTLVLDSVPWDQALDIVLKNNRLGKVVEGNVLRIARVETLTAEQEGQVKLADARMAAAPMVTVFRPINYAKAADIATLLKSWAGGGALSKRGTVLVDARSNTLIISDVQAQIPIIESIVAKLDRKAKQISIEARVVLASADFTRILSSALSGSGTNNSGTSQFGLATGATASITPATAVPPQSALTIPTSTGSGFGNIAITNASSRYLINAVLSAQETRDQVKTLSRPTIVTQNNVQGIVQQGVEIPIQTNINNTITTTYQNATLNLTVTPQVTDDNNIFLDINVNNASVGAPVLGIGSEINTQQANTKVLVPDGGTVVFGGITVTSRTKSATYVPWLGNIPLLGHLFKSSTTTDTDQELLFFVSPKILPS